jgi:hypothetical protein
MEQGPGEGPIQEALAAASDVTLRASCDFCQSGRGRWSYAAKGFSRTVNGDPRFRIIFSGPWTACAPCAKLIDADRWGALRVRVIERYNALHPGLTALQQAAQAEELGALWQQFKANRTGPAKAVRS